MTKGIILAGGSGTRLYPLTTTISKQLLPVYDKPMIYYPLAALMLMGIRDILIISTPADLPRIQQLLENGNQFGLNICYTQQTKPNGIAEAFIIGKDFIGKDAVSLILGDNIFYGPDFGVSLKSDAERNNGATIFAYPVKDPQRYGVAKIDKANRVTHIIEKPADPKWSHWAVTGLYIYDNTVVDIAGSLAPSARGELEITDVNLAYLEQDKLRARCVSRGNAWLDAGTPESLLDASNFIATLETRQGLKISCPEEIAYRLGYITAEGLNQLIGSSNSSYTNYLRQILDA